MSNNDQITMKFDLSKNIKVSEVKDEEWIKQDFRKALQILGLSFISTIILTGLIYLIEI